ncbi:MAG: glycosyltransferase family 4 protein [Candidatus Doudnabacteria bacterium]|nr:glycosyltransferase family 4 protein [Candidatus Doudnabacteria bacterium]
MIIGIEAERANEGSKTGVEHYAQQLILQLAEIDHENEYILYLRTQPQDWFLQLPKNFKIKILGYGPVKFPYLWTQLRLSWEMLVAAPDVLFVPAASLPLIHPKRSFITVHDVAWRLYPNTFKTLKRWYLEFTTWFACSFARKVIAVSESTKKDLIKYYGVPAEKVAVVLHGYTPQGVETRDTRLDSGVDPRRKRQETSQMQLPEKFVLFLSTLQPRKNLEGLIAAFRQFKQKHPDDLHKLVVAGRVGWKAESILQEIERNKDIVVYLNHVTDEDRAVLYAKASAFCVPSFYEGFGMWVLEAFDAGVPVITSRISSLPEVAGDAAEYCDPHNIDSIEQALEHVLLVSGRAERLVQEGKDRLKDFSWRKCAEQTLEQLRS